MAFDVSAVPCVPIRLFPWWIVTSPVSIQAHGVFRA
jgi:hypothetical protein